MEEDLLGFGDDDDFNDDFGDEDVTVCMSLFQHSMSALRVHMHGLFRNLALPGGAVARKKRFEYFACQFCDLKGLGQKSAGAARVGP